MGVWIVNFVGGKAKGAVISSETTASGVARLGQIHTMLAWISRGPSMLILLIIAECSLAMFVHLLVLWD